MHGMTPQLHGMKQYTLMYIGVAMALMFILMANTAQAKTFNVAIISSGANQIYTKIIGIIKKSASQKNKPFLTFTTYFADHLLTTDNDEISNADLLVTVGKRAMIAAAQRQSSPPILATLVPRQSFERYHSALASSNIKVSGIYIDPPPIKQIILAKLLLGNLQTVGILLSKDFTPDAQQINNIIKEAGLNANILTVNPADNIIRKLSRLISISDVLLALPDPLIINRKNARDILLTTYRKHIPVIGFSANYVKAGALAAVFSTPEQIAIQTGKTILDILNPASYFPMGGRYPDQFKVGINRNVAHSLGISVPDTSTIKKALESMLTEYK